MDPAGELSGTVPVEEPNPWAISIEEQTGSRNKRQWHLTALRRYPDRATARGAAARIARTHLPENPAGPTERMVLCSGPDDYLVALKGPVGEVFHVRVHVWEVVGLYDR